MRTPPCDACRGSLLTHEPGCRRESHVAKKAPSSEWSLYENSKCVGCNPVAVAEAAREEITLLRLAIYQQSKGANHIASQLIHRMGADFVDKCPHTGDGPVWEGDGTNYDMWHCWAAAMRARDMLNGITAPENVERLKVEVARLTGDYWR